jgi:hypothetical protein
LKEAQIIIESWRQHYNRVRVNSGAIVGQLSGGEVPAVPE